MGSEIVYETFYGQSEYEVENKMHMFLDDTRVIYINSEDYRLNDGSYGIALTYRYRPLEGN